MKLETSLIHSGFEESLPYNSLSVPIFQTSTFTFDDVDDTETQQYQYSRGANPTMQILENRVAIIEGGEACATFASGMGAISAVLLSLLKPNNVVICHKTIYGSANSFMQNLLSQYQVKQVLTDIKDSQILLEEIKKHGDNAKVVYFESPCNPTLEIVDIEAVCKVAHQQNLKVVFDNTFGTPYFQNPLSFGVDIVVHSATKYISGHGDTLGGLAISNKKYIDELKISYMSKLGSCISPFNAWLLLRGIKTLSIRMAQHEKNALALAQFLEKHPKILKVHYPGLQSFEGHDIAKKQMRGFGGMITFQIKGNLEETKQFINSVKLCKISYSLGDCESLIQLPALMTHRNSSKEEQKLMGITDSMVRLSVGIENIADLINDIDTALNKI